jgi:aminoglycoside phosphotransferase family enzyme/predicted kinase
MIAGPSADVTVPDPTSGTRARGPGALPELPPAVCALLRPETYPHPAPHPELRETHISWVVLAGDYAYKVKKPVDFGFLDFTSFEKRAAACADEVRLNRRLCPDVYLGVSDLVARNGAIRLGGPGRLVEPVVRMRRLPERGMLPALLRREVVDRRLAARIGRLLAKFHATAATGPGVDEFGAPEAIANEWEENFAQVSLFIGRALSKEMLEGCHGYVEAFLRDRRELLTGRVAEGRVREGHGDLHAANICVEGKRLHLFDCLEFSARFRCADVAAEVAFLAMDLDHYGRADLAADFVHAYVRASGDRELLDLLDFYKCYRAFVRGKVAALRLAEPGLAAAAAAESLESARAYFDLASAYAGGLDRWTLILVMGLPASGKTSLAAALAGRLGLVHLSSDWIRKELSGMPPTKHGADPFGRGLYAPGEKRRVYAALRRRAADHLRAGRPVVLDATFGDPSERAQVVRLAERLGARLVTLVCRADEATLRARLAARGGAANSTSDARPELWNALKRAYIEPVDLPAVIDIDTTQPLAIAAARAREEVVQAGS